MVTVGVVVIIIFMIKSMGNQGVAMGSVTNPGMDLSKTVNRGVRNKGDKEQQQKQWAAVNTRHCSSSRPVHLTEETNGAMPDCQSLRITSKQGNWDLVTRHSLCPPGAE